MPRLKSCLIAIITLITFQVDAQIVLKIDSLNGFKEYKLGSELKVDSNKTDCSNFFNDFPENNYPSNAVAKYKFTCITPKNTTIGSLKVLQIHITTFKNKIIRVIVNTETGELMSKIVKGNFGISQDCDNFIDSDPIIRRSEACIWKGNDTYLRFCSYNSLKGHVSTLLPEPWMINGFNSLTFTSKSSLEFVNSELNKIAKDAKKDF